MFSQSLERAALSRVGGAPIPCGADLHRGLADIGIIPGRQFEVRLDQFGCLALGQARFVEPRNVCYNPAQRVPGALLANLAGSLDYTDFFASHPLNLSDR
jgi:hypothetical protein